MSQYMQHVTHRNACATGTHFSNPPGKPTMTKKSVYIEKMKTQLDELNANMNKLEAKTQEAKADARDMYLQEMAKLRHQSKLAVAKLDDMKVATEETWETMVAEMEKVRDAFTHSFHYFKSQI
jgi:alpha-D-ribose 1-methylphosphonate 5-triphosphate diphosphatase PhnM